MLRGFAQWCQRIGKRDIVQPISTIRQGFRTQLAEVSSPLRPVDLIVFALILAIGAFQFFCVARASDFVQDDVFFADAARSLVQHGYYGINGYAETNMPPGVSWIFALLYLMGGGSHVAFLRIIAVFATLGFLASYEVLRGQVPRVVAAAICLLLISSRTHFELVTQQVVACYPYFLTAMGALLAAGKFEKATGTLWRVWWGTLLTLLIAASLMFASAGIALLGAIVATVGVTLFLDRRQTLTRLKSYVLILICGIIVQGFWMHHQVEASGGISAAEWSVPGFPQSYLSQLKVKDGRNPELGMATPRDIPVRMLKNAYERANLLSQMLLQRWIYLAWMSIATIGMLLLIAAGWCYSMWPSGGGLLEWYFAGHEFIYLLWPWELEARFFLPAAPLACLYAWRGGKALIFLAKSRPRLLGLAWFPIAILLVINSWFWMHGIGTASHLPHAGLQDETSFVVWLLSAILAAWMVWADTSWLRPVTLLRGRVWTISGQKRSLMRIAQPLGLVAVTVLVLIGLKRQVAIGRVNLDLNSTVNRLSADAEAGEWIRSHTDPNSIVMARHVAILCHYSNRNLIWLPPSSNPQLLMDGISRHKINFVVVVQRKFNYYIPSDDDSFNPLQTAYPGAFQLVHQGPEFRIFQVTPGASLLPKVGMVLPSANSVL
jgi:hypothetical protein